MISANIDPGCLSPGAVLLPASYVSVRVPGWPALDDELKS